MGLEGGGEGSLVWYCEWNWSDEGDLHCYSDPDESLRHEKSAVRLLDVLRWEMGTTQQTEVFCNF